MSDTPAPEKDAATMSDDLAIVAAFISGNAELGRRMGDLLRLMNVAIVRVPPDSGLAGKRLRLTAEERGVNYCSLHHGITNDGDQTCDFDPDDGTECIRVSLYALTEEAP